MLARGLISLAAFSALLALVSAKCEENCNGNGLCGAHDRCTCFQGYQGISCSDRVCPFGNAWIGDHGTYVECSAKGSCDRKAGLCKCQDGFSGKACQRMDCPGDKNCNGNGQCLSLSHINAGYTGWDAEMIQGCVCDPGYEGNDCSQRKCPRGDDALTVSSGGAQEQTITITDSTEIGGEFTLSFTSQSGETYSTWMHDASTCSAISIRESLEALPNKVIPSVTVEVTTDTTTSKVIKVTFSNAANSGSQNTLVSNTAACVDDGCRTVSAGLDSGTTIAITTSTVDSDYEFDVCSGRGYCDSEVGQCVCAEGYRGQACEKQTIFT